MQENNLLKKLCHCWERSREMLIGVFQGSAALWSGCSSLIIWCPQQTRGPDKIYPCKWLQLHFQPFVPLMSPCGAGSEGDIPILQGKEEGRESSLCSEGREETPELSVYPEATGWGCPHLFQWLLNYLSIIWFASSPPKCSRQEVRKFLKAFSHVLLQSLIENWKPFVSLRGRYFHWNFRDVIYHLKPSHDAL